MIMDTKNNTATQESKERAEDSALSAPPGSASVVANKLAEGLTPSWYEAAALLHDNQILSEVGRILKDTQHQLQDMRAERDWLLHLVATIRDKGNLRYNGNVHMLAFSDLKDEANRTFHSLPNVELRHGENNQQ